EWVHVQLHQQKGMISLSPPTICNSATSSMKGGKNGSTAERQAQKKPTGNLAFLCFPALSWWL
ncbi:hypothetical protein NBA34_23060, partial [Salmonella sp. NW13]